METTYPTLSVVHARRTESEPTPPPSARPSFWLIGLGVALLVGSVALTVATMNAGADGLGAGAPATPTGGKGERRAVAVAYVDVEGGVINLSPVQAGRVVGLPFGEGKSVKKGDVLLKMDDALAALRVKEAETDRDAAKEKAVQARKLVAQHKSKLNAAESGVESAKKDLAAAEAQAAKARRFRAGNLGGSEEDLTTADALVAKAKAGVRLAEDQKSLVEAMDPHSAIRLADLDVKAKEEQLDKARIGLRECTVKAPEDGVILRSLVNLGEVFAPNPQYPAIHFCPDRPLIVRAEVEQEFTKNLAVGRKATIEDELIVGSDTWTGEVLSISGWFTSRRRIILEPMQYNDQRTLEVIIKLDPKQKPLRINQRVRVKMEEK